MAFECNNNLKQDNIQMKATWKKKLDNSNHFKRKTFKWKTTSYFNIETLNMNPK